ncbi:MAG: hypothetical protein ABUS56_03220 [Acidobacteriota bacterium]
MRRALTALLAASLVLALTGAATRSAAAEDPPIGTVLGRAAAYVDTLVEELRGIVAEERYTQDVVPPNTLTPGLSISGGSGRGALPSGARPSTTRQHRDLRSDLLLVRPIGSANWVQFRDVVEVDGRPVHDRDGRLQRLFLHPQASIAAQLSDIAQESARYNIGNLERTVNVPVLPLVFLARDLQGRFEFTRVDQEGTRPPGASTTPNGVPGGTAFAISRDAWEIRYKETATGTLIRTTASRDLPAHGRFWIEPLTGRVLMTELLLDDPFVHAAVHVVYRIDQKLGLLAPADMREAYVLHATNVRIEGAAKYARFRKFQVTVDEDLAPIK